MRVRTRFAAGLSFCLALSALAVPQAGPSSDTPVTTIVSDYDSGIGPALQIQSDQLGAYVNSKAVASLMHSVGSWELDSYYVRNATRAVYLSFSQAIAGSGPNGGAPVAVPTGYYKAQVSTECFHYNTNPTTMAPGSTISCPMSVRFDAGGKTYTVHMNPRNANWAGTNPVTMSCIFPTSGTNPCSQWRITPSSSVVNPDGSVTIRSIGQLDLVGTSKGSDTYTKQGQFSFSFSILVTKP